jgi:two-component system, cell cycle sensor histidine kinase and response regulator CckA
LNNEVKQITAILERTLPKMISIDVHLENSIHDINADALQIEQILMNLAVNAQHAMPEGGRLTIETQNVALDREYCTSHLGAKAGEYVILAVSDNGIGMDRETMDRMYDPFFTTKKGRLGSGLGLSMVYGIVKSHGGYIMCYSEPGRGAAFKIYFPALCTYRRHETAEKHVDELHGGKETILVIDDNQAVRQFAEHVISGFGYKVLTADSGEEALSLYKADAGAIDLLVLDLDMPGMGGTKCLEELIRIDPGVKVVVASGLSPDGKVRKILESGTGTFIGKPFQVSQIIPKIRDVLDW